MSKRLLVCFILFLAVSLAVPLSGFCQKKTTLSVALTGDVSGQIWPVKACAPSTNSEGGLSRRARIVDVIRKTEPDLLLLDSGNILPEFTKNNLEIKAEISLKAMDIMGYEALNVGPQDLRLGTEYLREKSKGLSFELISSNIVYKKDGEHFAKPFIVKKIKGLQVAVLGVVPSDALNNAGDAPGISALEVLDPEKALEKTLAAIEEKTDFIILLSLLEPNANKKLLEKFKQIGLLVSSDKLIDPNEKNFVKPRLYMTPAYRGTNLLYIRVLIAEETEAPQFVTRKLTLNDALSDDERIDRLIQAEYTKKAKQERLERIKDRSEEMHDEFSETLKLSPEEYIRKIQENESNGKDAK